MLEFLTDYAASRPVSFHMPGHKGAALFERYGYGDFLQHLCDCDITEIPGADNLFRPEGIIRDVQRRYADLYDMDRSYLMVNGTSGGLMAAVMAAVPPGGRLIMARNCHKSIYNGLILGGIQPVYVYPEIEASWGICGPVDPGEIQRALQQYPDAAAVVLPSPNYYGLCSDIAAIAGIVHDAGKILIVDQAHGAHLHFFHKYHIRESLPPSAESCGADITVDSTHKTLASLTQSAVLNMQGERIDPFILEDCIQRVETTSPSYILMAFLDINARILKDHGREALAQWDHALQTMQSGLRKIEGLRCLDGGPLMDTTKIDLSLAALGLDGAALEAALRRRGIFSELYTGDLLMLMTGIGTTEEDGSRLLAALRIIAAEARAKRPAGVRAEKAAASALTAGLAGLGGELHPVPPRRRALPLAKAAGCICAGAIVPYPPGVPFCCPGERITEEIVDACAKMRRQGMTVLGISEDGCVMVGQEG